jgi:hypothetical protein
MSPSELDMRKRSPGLGANDTRVLKDLFEFVRGLSGTMCSQIRVLTHKCGGQTICVRKFVSFSALKDFNGRLRILAVEREQRVVSRQIGIHNDVQNPVSVPREAWEVSPAICLRR